MLPDACIVTSDLAGIPSLLRVALKFFSAPCVLTVAQKKRKELQVSVGLQW